MNITARGESVILVLDDGAEHVIDQPMTIWEQLRYAANDAVRTRQHREQTERRAARVAEWLANHPNATEIDDGRWWDAASLTVLDRDNDRLTPRELRSGSVPTVRVRVRSGRVGHLWTGGPETACGKWLDFGAQLTEAKLCANCARIQGAP